MALTCPLRGLGAASLVGRIRQAHGSSQGLWGMRASEWGWSLQPVVSFRREAVSNLMLLKERLGEAEMGPGPGSLPTLGLDCPLSWGCPGS